MSNRTENQGFTLIELMITLAVAAVVLTLAVPSLGDLQQRNRQAAAANELVAHLNVARLHAVTYREITIACPADSTLECGGHNRWHDGWIVFRDPDRDNRPNDAADLLRVGTGLEGLWSDSAGRTLVRYRPEGNAYGTNQTIKLCDPGGVTRPRAVIISNPGRPRVDDLPNHLSCPGSP